MSCWRAILNKLFHGTEVGWGPVRLRVAQGSGNATDRVEGVVMSGAVHLIS